MNNFLPGPDQGCHSFDIPTTLFVQQLVVADGKRWSEGYFHQ